MSPEPQHIPPVMEEVRQRRVGKVVIAYLAVGFAVIEGSTSFLPMTALPEWVSRAVLGAVVLGFPVTVVLAWTYDITPEGVVRTPDDLSTEPAPTSSTWLVLTVLGIVVGTVLHVLRG